MTSTARATGAATNRRLVTCAAHALQARLAWASLRSRGQSTRGPMPPSRAGKSVTTTTIETRGMSIPPMPVDRSPGTGSTMSAISPMATVMPESTTERPAVSTALTTAAWLSAPRARSSRQRVTSNSE